MFLPRSPAPSERDSSSARLVSVHPNTWAAATTAPASVQVHYHYLAGRYRDLSSENGLGLARLAAVPEAPTTTAGSASGSDRGSVKSAASAAKLNLTGIFLGAPPPKQRDNVELLAVPAAKLSAHARGNSKRDYAKERLRQDEVLQRRIQGTRDVGRLKWEAKSALLSASHPLAISLLTRAASLGSLSSALTLAGLHASGATRGTAPVVVLVQRDPLRALAWALEASALLRRRSESRTKRGEAARSDDVETRRQLAALLARLVRTPQADATRVKGNDVALPDAAKPSAASTQLWASLAPLLSWLSAANVSNSTSAASTPAADLDEVEDEDGNERAFTEAKLKASMAVDLAILRALALTRATLAPGEGGWAEAVRREWEEAEEAVTAARNAGVQDWNALQDVLAASHALCDALSGGKKKIIDQAAAALASACEASLPESSVPAVPDTNACKAAIAAAAAPSIITSSPRKGGSVQGQTSPRRTALGRRRSLEDLEPNDVRAAHARAPALLAPRGSVAPRAERSAAEALIVACGDDSPRRRLGRTMSLQTGLVAAAATTAPGNGPSKKASESLLPLLRDASGSRPGLKARRPSSVCSDSPSLLFPPRNDEYELGGRPSSPSLEVEESTHGGMSQASSSNSLWAAAAGKPVGPPRVGASAARRRVASLYGTPSMAPPATINTQGASTKDYGDVGNGVFDPTASLRSAQSRRRRVDSDASISTALSVLSTAPSIAESMAWEREAPIAAFGMDRANERGGQLGAADSLRKLRTQSSTGSLAPRDGPAAPMLTDRLERTIAASSSYRAASGSGSVRGAPGPRQRKTSSASISSLSSFVSTTSRQGANGNFRAPTTMLGLTRSTSQANTTAAAAGGSKSGGVISALGSLKRLGGSSSTARKSKAVGLEAIFTQPAEQGRRSLDVSRPPRQSSEGGGRSSLDLGGLRLPPNRSASGSASAAVSPSTSRRSFAHLDPTSFDTYAGGRSGPTSPAVERDSLIPLSPTPMSPAGGTPSREGARSPSVASELDYALAAAEDRSRLKTAAGCDECGAVVINGAISRTGEKYCGRTCRMAAKAKKRAGKAAAEEEDATTDKGKGKQSDA